MNREMHPAPAEIAGVTTITRKRYYEQEKYVYRLLARVAWCISMKGLIEKQVSGKNGEAVKTGRMGEIAVRDGGLMVMGEPFVFNADNIDEWSQVF